VNSGYPSQDRYAGFRRSKPASAQTRPVDRDASCACELVRPTRLSAHRRIPGTARFPASCGKLLFASWGVRLDTIRTPGMDAIPAVPSRQSRLRPRPVGPPRTGQGCALFLLKERIVRLFPRLASLVGQTFAPEKPADPFISALWKKLLLGAVFVQLCHRPFRERQSEVFGLARCSSDERPNLLRAYSHRSAIWVRNGLKRSKTAVVEPMDPVIYNRQVATHPVGHICRRPAPRQLADNAVAFPYPHRERLVAELCVKDTPLIICQCSYSNSWHMQHLCCNYTTVSFI